MPRLFFIYESGGFDKLSHRRKIFLNFYFIINPSALCVTNVL